MKAGLAALGAIAVLLAGCTTVPSHSAPETIGPVPLNTAVSSGHPPPPGASPREIVQDFLDTSAAEAGAEGSALDYLTRAARARWQDSHVTIVDATSVSNFSPPHPTITVRGREIGNVDASGVYKPTNDGIGSGGKVNPYTYRIKKVRGQYRIDGLPPGLGLLLTVEQFTDVYASHALEFYDLAPHYLIPDMRYSPLHAAALADWLMSQLAAGPRPELQNAVSSSVGLPAPGNGTPVSVKLGEVTTVAVPGAAQLARGARDLLAAQIGRTLVDVVGSSGFLSIVDSGKPIEIPAVGSNQFVPAQFDAAIGPAQPPAELYYLRGGRVVGENGKPLIGAGVDGTTPLNSVAVASSDQDPNSLLIAGNRVASGTDKLYVGTQQLGLRPTDVAAHVADAAHLPLTRPAWAPGRAEVWIGAGRTLYRLTVSGVAAQRYRVPLPSNVKNAPIKAVRISPDGSRIALVLGEAGATQLFEGAIVRTAGQVRVDGFPYSISPVGVSITDVAWIDSLKLFAIGYLRSNLDAKVCEVNVDGSGWAIRGVPGLPGPYGPNSVTITANALAWVSVHDTVWRQSGSIWASPSSTGIGQITGTNPVYLE